MQADNALCFALCAVQEKDNSQLSFVCFSKLKSNCQISSITIYFIKIWMLKDRWIDRQASWGSWVFERLWLWGGLSVFIEFWNTVLSFHIIPVCYSMPVTAHTHFSLCVYVCVRRRTAIFSFLSPFEYEWAWRGLCVRVFVRMCVCFLLSATDIANV